MSDRYQHHQEIISFLQNQLSRQPWKLSVPVSGWGHETYIARAGEQSYFVKLGAHTPRYQIMASLGLTPEVVSIGCLADGISVIVQPFLAGRSPSWGDFQHYLKDIAAIIKKTHHSQALKNVLPGVSSGHTKDLGLAAILRV